MSRLLRVTINRHKDGHEVLWESGNSHMTRDFLPQSAVALGPDTRRALKDLLDTQDRDAQRALGRHLWCALAAPTSAWQQAEIELVSTDVDVLALPWQLVADEVGWLESRQVGLRCVWQEEAEPRSLGSRLHLLATPTDLWADDQQDWRDALTPLGAGEPTVRVAADAQDLLARLRNLDLLFLAVETSRLRAEDSAPLPLPLEGSLDWNALLEAVREQPPGLILLECPGLPPYALARKAALLARHACTVLLGRPADADPPLAPGDLARRFIDLLRSRDCSPSEGARLLAQLDRLPAQFLPRCFGGRIARRPPPNSIWRQWWDHPGWRKRLDRVDQTDLAMGRIRKVWRNRKLGAGLVLAWQGPSQSGLLRFKERLDYEIREVEDPPQGCIELPLGWPEEEPPSEDDFLVRYAHGLNLSLRDAPSPQARSALFKQGVGAALEHSFPPSDTPHQVLLIHHGLLEGHFFPEQIDVRVLQLYLRWWAHDFLPLVPRRLTPVLLLPLEESASAGWPPAPVELDRLGRDLRNCEVKGLPRLPDVEAHHLEDLFYQHQLPIPEHAWEGVAAEIYAHTHGHYEDTVHAVELLPWTWKCWYRKSLKRKT